MRITSVIEHNGEPAIRITDAPTTEALYRTKIKAFCTGVTLEGFKSAIHDEGGDIIGITRFFDVSEQVAYIAEPVRPDDIEAWFASPRSIPLLDFLASRSSEDPAPETDNASSEDQDHEQDHELEAEPGVVQDELETGQDLTGLQQRILDNLDAGGPSSVADLMHRMGLESASMQASVRKNLHALLEMGRVKKHTELGPTNRPVQIWEVL